MSKKELRPTDDDRLALVAVVECAHGWVRAAGAAGAMIESLGACHGTVRAFLAGAATRGTLDAAARSLGPRGANLGVAPVAQAVGEVRDGTILVLGICVAAPVDEETFLGWRRGVVGHLERAGALLGVDRTPDALRLVHDNAARAARTARGARRTADATDRATRIAWGQAIALQRQRRGLTVEALCVAVKEAGGRLTAAQLARVERGTADLAVVRGGALARGLGVEAEWLDDRVATAIEAARALAAQAVGVGGEEWFGGVCALQGGGDEVARAFLLSMVAAALWKE